MGLLIDQGKQIADEYTVLEGKNIPARIEAVALHPTFDRALQVTLVPIQGAHQGRRIRETVNYDPGHSFVWKYKNLRRAAGCPVVGGESERIDIEALLLNKILMLDLGKRVDSSGKEWQDIKYRAMTSADIDAISAAKPAVSNTSELPTAPWTDEQTLTEVSDEKLPF